MIAADRPKPFVQVGGRPILSWGLAAFDPARLTGIALVVPPGWTEQAFELAADAQPEVPRLAIEQGHPQGTLDAFRLGLAALAQVNLHDRARAALLFLHGDNIPPAVAADQALDRLGGSDAVILSRYTDRPGSGARVRRDAAGRATALIKDETRIPEGECEVSTGLFAYGAWIWSGLQETLASVELPTAERRIDDLNAALLAAGRAEVVPVEARWIHINTAEDLAEAERILGRSD